MEYCRICNIRKGPYNKSRTSPVTNTDPAPPSSPAKTHKVVKNIVLVPYTPKANEWGSWQVKDSQVTSSAAVNSISNEQKEEVGQVYQLHSLYYSPEYPSEFYEDE